MSGLLRRSHLAVTFLLALPLASVVGQGSGYVPPPDDEWAHRRPSELGMDSAKLAEAVAFALAHESPLPRDLHAYLEGVNGGDSLGDLVGPIKNRGGSGGVILRGGYVVAQWGETDRVDMTFSVTKSYLSTLAGLALDSGLIRDMHDRVAEYVDDGGYRSAQNAPITWHHMLQQTNEWEGNLWGKPDVADRRRGRDRELNAPGSFWEYNDVRVNRTAYSLLQVWREPLPLVLKKLIMDPIGASDSWRWHGYRTSWVTIDGQDMQSVSGGGHWGGGIWINLWDHARFGLLFLRRGLWGDRALFDESWVDRITTPTDVRSDYGYMWWLNTDGQLWPSAPSTSYAARGGNLVAVWIDPEHDLVAVVRWINNADFDGFLSRVLGAVIE